MGVLILSEADVRSVLTMDLAPPAVEQAFRKLSLDEATNCLDVVARRAVLEFARSYKTSGRVVLYSTHIMSEAEELCTRAAIIDHGRLIALDTVENLKANTQSGTLEDAFFKLTRAQNRELEVNL